MKWNALSHLPCEAELAAPRRWWLGWLQLLFAWLACMLVCANVGLLLARHLDGGEETASAVPHQMACVPHTLVTSPVNAKTRHAEGGSDGFHRCNGA